MPRAILQRKPFLEANITFSNKNDNAYLNASQMDIIKKVLCNNSFMAHCNIGCGHAAKQYNALA